MVHVTYLTNDLLFSSRVSSLAKAAGVELRVAGSKQMLLDDVAANATRVVLLDLEHRDAQVADLIASLGAARPKIVAYGPHVKETLLAVAQVAGCDVVLSRGQFDKQIGVLFQTLSSEPEQHSE